MTYAYRPPPSSDMVTKVTKPFFKRLRRFFVGHGSGGLERPFVTFVTVSLGVGGAGAVRAAAVLVDALPPSLRGLFRATSTSKARNVTDYLRGDSSQRIAGQNSTSISAASAINTKAAHTWPGWNMRMAKNSTASVRRMMPMRFIVDLDRRVGNGGAHPTPVSRFSLVVPSAGNSSRDFALFHGAPKGVVLYRLTLEDGR